MPRHSVWRTHLTILLVYGLLAVLLTWPTVTHLATHLPGDGGDDPAIAWNLWWVKYALLTLHTNPLFSSAMFYPIGINLAFYTLTTLNALTALPLTLTLGVVAASNIHMWFTFVAGGYGAFLLARYMLAGDLSAKKRGALSPPSPPLLPTSYSLLPTPSFAAAALAGVFYAFASSQLFYVSLGQFNIASSHWVPYTILFVMKSRRDLQSLRWPALAALFLIMQAWAEMTYASFLAVFIGLYVVYEIGVWMLGTRDWRLEVSSLKSQIPNLKSQIANRKSQIPNPKSQIANRKSQIPNPKSQIANRKPLTSNLQLLISNFKSPLTLVLLFTLGISPLLAAMIPDLRAEGDFLAQGSGFAESFSADLLGFVLPTMHHPLLGGLVQGAGIVNFTKGQHIYLGLSLLLLAGIGAVGGLRQRQRRSGFGFWLLAAGLFAWLTLGPTVHVKGADTGLPGPFALLQALPLFKGNRYPSRYSVLLILSLAMLAAIGIDIMLRRRPTTDRSPRNPLSAVGSRWSAVVGLLSALFLFEHLSIPLPQSDMTVPAPYYAIAAEPGQFTLLDIPLAWRNGFRITGPLHPGFMFGQFYQTVHGRPLLQGNTSRNPEFKFQYFTEAPVINSIISLETGHVLPPERWQADQLVAADVLRFFGIRYVVVRPGPGTDPAVTPEATLPYVEGVLPVVRTYHDPALTVYRVNLPPLPEQVEVSPAAPLARLYFAEGWGGLTGHEVWAQRQAARLFVPLAGGPQRVTLRLFAPGEGQRVAVSLNGWRSTPVPLVRGWGDYTLSLPDGAVWPGLNEIHLDFDRVYPVTSVWPGAAVALFVQSAGEEVGDFGHIYVNGVDVSPNQRGYNLAVIGPAGSFQTASFDTHLDPGASARLAAFIAAVPDGQTVAVAAADEASMHLGEDAVVALRSIGAAGDLRGRFRWSQAIIGVKGAAPGSALEAMDGLRPVGVAAGPAVTEPAVAAAVASIRFDAGE
jgi:hypothetical protein